MIDHSLKVVLLGLVVEVGAVVVVDVVGVGGVVRVFRAAPFVGVDGVALRVLLVDGAAC